MIIAFTFGCVHTGLVDPVIWEIPQGLSGTATQSVNILYHPSH